MKWKNLSKEQVRKILVEIGHPVSMYQFAREIQKKLKEINHERSGVCNCGRNSPVNRQASVRCSDE